MSTFLGLIKEIPGISVDRFDNENLNSSAYFLSHCHEDHMMGLSSKFFRDLEGSDKYLYCSPISKAILESKYNLSVQCIKEITINQEIGIKYRDTDGYSEISVTCISAGHCPGSVMFLFNKEGKLILYTGDFRINPSDYKKIGPLHVFEEFKFVPKKLTKIYLDTTFLDRDFNSLPTRKESLIKMRGVIEEWLEKDPGNVVVLKCPAKYGYEFLYIELSKALNMYIHVKHCVYDTYCRILELKHYITSDPLLTRIHACVEQHDRMICRSDVREKNILTIVPSVMRWRGKDTSIVGEWNEKEERMYNVCYSTHPSYDELEKFVRYFKPKRIFPCVCPEGSEQNIRFLLNRLNKIKRQKFIYVIKCRRNPTLRVPKLENIDKPWAKYYFSK